MPDFMGLMKQATQLQTKMQEMQAELDQIEVEGSAGGGLVIVKLSARGEMRGVTIDASLLKPDEKEIVEDLVVAAHADAPPEVRATVLATAGRPDEARALLERASPQTPIERVRLERLRILFAISQAIGDATMPMRVIAGVGDVDSAAPGFALWELSRMVNASPAFGASRPSGERTKPTPASASALPSTCTREGARRCQAAARKGTIGTESIVTKALRLGVVRARPIVCKRKPPLPAT